MCSLKVRNTHQTWICSIYLTGDVREVLQCEPAEYREQAFVYVLAHTAMQMEITMTY